MQAGNCLHAFFFYYFCCCWCLCHFSHRSWMLLFVLETICMLSSKSCSCAIVAVKASDCCFSPALDYIAILAPLLSGFLERPVPGGSRTTEWCAFLLFEGKVFPVTTDDGSNFRKAFRYVCSLQHHITNVFPLQSIAYLGLFHWVFFTCSANYLIFVLFTFTQGPN